MIGAPLPPLPEPFFADGDHIGIVLGGARALFTTRRGGHSRGPYESLNLGRFTADDPVAVEANRAALQERVGRRLVYARQVHGADVQRRTADATIVPSEKVPGDRLPDLDDPRAETGDAPADADGQATDSPSLAPLVLTADCLPVVIAAEGAVAIVHAGWRGLVAGVIAAGVQAVCELGRKGPLRAAIGPGAGPCCYEVGEEVLRALGDERSAGPRRRSLDLKAIARRQLLDAGVRTVHDVGLCTICSDPSLFFSHRRDGATTGRQGAVGWLTR